MTGEHVIYAISDSTGETAEQAIRAALAQFRPRVDVRTLVFGRVRDEASATALLQRAKEEDALVVYTLVEPTQRALIKRLINKYDVSSVDLLSGLMLEISHHLDRKPLSVAGLGHETDDDYFRRIEAVEFTVQHDDGRHPDHIEHAEIVLVGVSRTSKTPLSNYIAHRGYKVANVPIVKDLPPPMQLEMADPKRVFALVIDPNTLMNIRRRRMEVLGMDMSAQYGDPDAIRKEILWSRRLFRDHAEWTVIDVTDRAVEETAASILEMYRERFATSPRMPVSKRKKKSSRTKKTKGSAS